MHFRKGNRGIIVEHIKGVAYSNSIDKVRDIRLDILRFFGIVCIVLAHVSPPDLLFQLRNFDVPLMVLVSGTAFSISSRSEVTYGKYLSKRLNRLLTPTWIFLTGFFLVIYIFSVIMSREYPFTINTILSSYSLTSGIGYVWIVRVFLITAMVSPFLLYLSRKIKSNVLYFAMIAAIYGAYELSFLVFGYTDNTFLSFVLENFIYVLLPYGCLAALGMRIPKMRNKTIMSMMFFFSILFCSLALILYSNGFTQTQDYKYPARLYYISYALFITLILYLLSNGKLFVKIFSNKAVKFISFSSFWIYLWHIFYLYFWSEIKKLLPFSLDAFYINFIIVFSLSCVTTYIQRKLVERASFKTGSENGVVKAISKALLG